MQAPPLEADARIFDLMTMEWYDASCGGESVIPVHGNRKI